MRFSSHKLPINTQRFLKYLEKDVITVCDFLIDQIIKHSELKISIH